MTDMTRLDAYRALLALEDDLPKPALVWRWKQADRTKVQMGRAQ